MVEKIKPKADYFFEVSWEVCHQVGGIYAVIKSKVANLLEFYSDNYYLIGPYFPKEAAIKFEKRNLPIKFDNIFKELAKEGIRCYEGKWTIEDKKVNTILIDFSDFEKSLNKIKKELWDDYKIDSSGVKGIFNTNVVWATAAGKLLEKLKTQLKGKKVVAQFHEWQSGAGLLYLKKRKSKIATVFTTHATILGRTITSEGINLYENIKSFDPKAEAYKYNIHEKFLTEKACASNANIFTTVSEITAVETTALLGKKPDIILPNGLDISQFPSLEERAIYHDRYKKRIKTFLQVFFYPYYRFEIDNSLIYFISGRYEFRNKGIDVFIEALSILNKRLIKEKSSRTIAVFIWIPAKTIGVDVKLLENKIQYDGIENFITDSLNQLKWSIVNSIVKQKMPTTHQLFTDKFHYQLKKKMIEFKKTGKALILTHKLEKEKDIISMNLKKFGLNNSNKDKVKVVYYPAYLTGSDGLLNLTYYDAIMGCHLGIFPSYYEPWGYTPLETGALGVPFVTTDLAGFGIHLLKGKFKGITVLKRDKRKRKTVVSDLADYMFKFSKLGRSDRIKTKLEARELAAKADWKFMIANYIKAHNLALGKIR